MVERNLIQEGFVFNTLTSSGVVSGTQTVSIPQINELVDDDFSTTALTISGTFFTVLDADLGARWKLTQLELHTDDSSAANFDMLVSENGLDFVPITMTGSAGLWVGSMSGLTVSGAPRYIRYEHRAPSADVDIQEWRATNDESLVDFGADGNQTEAEIPDATIGSPSPPLTLTLFNKFSTTAQGFVVIEDTGNKGDDNIEISLNSNGPWVGRKLQNTKQPDSTPWIELDSFGDLPITQTFAGAEVTTGGSSGVASVAED